MGSSSLISPTPLLGAATSRRNALLSKFPNPSSPAATADPLALYWYFPCSSAYSLHSFLTLSRKALSFHKSLNFPSSSLMYSTPLRVHPQANVLSLVPLAKWYFCCTLTLLL